MLLAAVLSVQRALDLPLLLTPRGHILAGALLYPLFLVVVWRHIARITGHGVALLTLLALLSPASVFWIHVPPSFAMLMGGVLLLPLTFVYARIHRSAHARYIVIGVLTLAIANVVFVSGIFLGLFNAEALSGDLLGRRRTTELHVVLGLVATVLVTGHSLMTYYGRRFAPAARRISVALPMLAGFLILVGISGSLSRAQLEDANYGPADTGLPGGNRIVSMHAIEPGVAGGSVAPERFVDPATCGNQACHPHIYDQWLVSGHRFSAINRAYQKVVELLAQEEGAEATRFCASCHNPLVAMMGETEASGDSAVTIATRLGITCQYCHIITGSHPEQGNGQVEVTFEKRFRPSFGIQRFVSRTDDTIAFFTAEGLVSHNADYKRQSYFESEFCAACHRVVVPRELNGSEDLAQEDLYTPWLHSSSAEMGISCVGCHMQLHVFEDRVHARPDHRTFGAIRDMSRLVPPGLETPGALEAFDADAERWAAGELPVSLYEQAYLRSISSEKVRAHRELLHGRRAMTMTMRFDTPSWPEPGESFEIRVSTVNGTHAHPLPSGPLDLNELWLELIVTDGAGRRVFESGLLDERGRLGGDTHRLGGTVVDLDGKAIQKHRIWKAARVVDERMLAPDGEVEDRFTITVPMDAKAPLTATARWRLRRYNADFAEWVFGDEWRDLPIHTVASSRAELDRETVP